MSEQVGLLFEAGKSTASFENDLFSMDFDANLSEGHSWSNDVTTNPVERGSEISDHIRRMPDQLTLVGMVTNTPINLLTKNKEGDVIDDQSENRVDDRLGILQNIMNKNQLVQVYTKYLVYPDMAITSIDFTRDASNTNSLIFTIQFKNVRIVSTQTVDVPAGISKKLDKKSDAATQKKTEPQKVAGAKQPKEPEKASSVLSNTLPKLKEFISGKLPSVPGVL